LTRSLNWHFDMHNLTEGVTGSLTLRGRYEDRLPIGTEAVV
jgi:hypothetical protein